METRITHRLTGSVIFKADVDGATESIRLGLAVRSAYESCISLSGADLSGADLAGAYLAGVYLSGADLSGANLAGADLARANLAYADLSGADLARANLAGAYLAGAKGINKYTTTPLYLLLDQPGKIRAYKIVLENGEGVYARSSGYAPIVYEVGKTYRVEDACIDEHVQCAAGISLATLDWCIKEWWPCRRILIAEFEVKDIAAIPIGSDGKFRVQSCTIVGEKDLKELGLTNSD